MCGIVCAFDLKQPSDSLRSEILEMSKKIRHRGPDWSGIYSSDNAIMSHERLAIVDPKSGRQPLFSYDNKLVLAANGEIYNHKELRIFLEKKGIKFHTDHSDTEVLLNGISHLGNDFINKIVGQFSIVFFDEKKQLFTTPYRQFT